jgi:hypothetical protein
MLRIRGRCGDSTTKIQQLSQQTFQLAQEYVYGLFNTACFLGRRFCDSLLLGNASLQRRAKNIQSKAKALGKRGNRHGDTVFQRVCFIRYSDVSYLRYVVWQQ